MKNDLSLIRPTIGGAIGQYRGGKEPDYVDGEVISEHSADPANLVSTGIPIDREVLRRVRQFIARDELEFTRNPSRCVIVVPDARPFAEPIRIIRYRPGYAFLAVAVLAVFSGWHFIRPYIWPLYYANIEGLHLIAEHGCPHKAYSALLAG